MRSAPDSAWIAIHPPRETLRGGQSQEPSDPSKPDQHHDPHREGHPRLRQQFVLLLRVPLIIGEHEHGRHPPTGSHALADLLTLLRWQSTKVAIAFDPAQHPRHLERVATDWVLNTYHVVPRPPIRSSDAARCHPKRMRRQHRARDSCRRSHRLCALEGISRSSTPAASIIDRPSATGTAHQRYRDSSARRNLFRLAAPSASGSARCSAGESARCQAAGPGECRTDPRRAAPGGGDSHRSNPRSTGRQPGRSLARSPGPRSP
jgi:hypothetical protein